MLEEAKSDDYTWLTTTATGLWAVTRWFIREGILGQFSIAKEMQDEEVTQ